LLERELTNSLHREGGVETNVEILNEDKNIVEEEVKN